MWELSQNPTWLSKILTHLVIVFTALCLRSWLHTALRLLWTHVLELTDQPHVLGLNRLAPRSELCIFDSAPESRSQLTNVLRPFIRSRRFLRLQLFVWSSHQSRQKGHSRHSDAGQKMPKIKSLLWPPIYEHTQRPTHIYLSIYLSIYDIMWVVRQANDSFDCFGTKPKGLDSRSPTWPEMGGGTEVWEKPGGQLAKEPREGELAKGDAERQSTTVSRRKQWGRRSKMSWHS